MTSRDRVRIYLINPLTDAGMTRKRGVTTEMHDKFLKALIDQLAYLSEEGLTTLRGMVAMAGTGAGRDVWPKSVTITAWANEVEPRPLRELPNLLSWFRSVEGPKALAGGFLVESYLYFRKYKRPAVGYAHTKIQEEAVENNHKRQRIEERVQRGVALQDEIAWLAWYSGKLAYCETLVGQKQKDGG